jgi:hypothetical protein
MRSRSCSPVHPWSMPGLQGKLVFLSLLAHCGSSLSASARADDVGGPGDRKVSINIDATALRAAVNPRMYGVFFEEINHAGDGGLHAELVQNRDFEVHNAPPGSRFNGNALVTPQGWIERVWFNTDVHTWEPIAEGGAKGSIRQGLRTTFLRDLSQYTQ